MRTLGYLLIATTLLLTSGGVALRSSADTHALTAGASPSNPIVTATAEVQGPPHEAIVLAHELALSGLEQCSSEPTLTEIKGQAPGGAMALNSRGYNYVRPGELRPSPVPAAAEKTER